METTNNIPETKVKLTDKEHLKLFMQYADQAIYCNGKHGTMSGAHGGCITAIYPRENKIHLYGEIFYSHEFDAFSIILKPLGEISEEDAKHLFVLAGWTEPNEIKINEFDVIEGRWLHGYDTNFVHPRHLRQNQADYLRKKGYAVMYENYSVEQLVEAGIYKIIQKENGNNK